MTRQQVMYGKRADYAPEMTGWGVEARQGIFSDAMASRHVGPLPKTGDTSV